MLNVHPQYKTSYTVSCGQFDKFNKHVTAMLRVIKTAAAMLQ